MSDPKWMTVNLNQVCRVQLTELGRSLHHRHHQTTFAAFRIPYVAPNEDADGWSEWAMWELFQLYGQHLKMGMTEAPFNLDIQIKDGPL